MQPDARGVVHVLGLTATLLASLVCHPIRIVHIRVLQPRGADARVDIPAVMLFAAVLQVSE